MLTSNETQTVPAAFAPDEEGDDRRHDRPHPISLRSLLNEMYRERGRLGICRCSSRRSESPAYRSYRRAWLTLSVLVLHERRTACRFSSIFVFPTPSLDDVLNSVPPLRRLQSGTAPHLNSTRIQHRASPPSQCRAAILQSSQRHRRNW